MPRQKKNQGNTEKPKAQMWKAGDDVMTSLKQLVAKFHPDLALIVDHIAVVFKEKATKSGSLVVAGKTSKASPLFGILGDTPWQFVITLGADVWNEFNDKQRIALLDHHLCGIRSNEVDGGEMKYYIQPPDVAFYKDELERHGLWRTTGSTLQPDMINALCGDES